MAARVITYFQKGKAPDDPQTAKALMTLAYQAIGELKMEAKQVLIR